MLNPKRGQVRKGLFQRPEVPLQFFERLDHGSQVFGLQRSLNGRGHGRPVGHSANIQSK